MGLLLAIVTAALAVSSGSRLLGNDLRRDREEELLAVGDEIRRAIEAYHAKNSGGMNPFPRRLEWLLKDPNQPTTQRYLRRLYRDPLADRDTVRLTEPVQWGLILDVNGQIVGVHSTSTREPLKSGNFPKQYEAFREARRYSDWRFIAAGGVPANPAVAVAAAGRNFIPAPGAPTLLTPPDGAVPGKPATPAAAGLAAPQPVGAVVAAPTVTPPPPATVEPPPTAVPPVHPPEPQAPPAAQPPAPGAPGAAPSAASTPTAPAASAAATPAPTATPLPDSFTTTPQSFVIRAPTGF